MIIGALYIITRLVDPCSSFLAVKAPSKIVLHSYYQHEHDNEHDNEVCKSKSNSSHESGNNKSKYDAQSNNIGSNGNVTSAGKCGSATT